MTLTHVDLFAGIGGFSTALERAGAKTVAAVEVDKYCQEQLRLRFPDVTVFGDIKEVSGDDLRAAGFVPERGVITGGFPCQDISVAGRGAGLAGARSGLFSEIVRLLDDLQPRWFVLENVPRLLSINGGRDMATVLGALAGSGYGVAWRVLDAQYFGVPQRRRRVFIVGCLGDTGRAPAEILFEPEGLPGSAATSGETLPQATASTSASAGNSRASVDVTSALLSVRRGTPSSEEVAGGQAIIETAPETAATLTAGVARSPGVNPPGRRQEDDENLVAYVADSTSTLQGGGRRGYRIDAEAAAGGQLIAALTTNGVGVSGPDDNQAQAGHLIASERL